MLKVNKTNISHFSQCIKKYYAFTASVLAVIAALSIPAISECSDEVVIGVLHWEGFNYSSMMKSSHDMALAKINNEGGINGRKLKLVYADDKGKRKAGEEAVKKLARDSKAVMLVGGYSSSNTVYTAGMADNLNMPFIISTAADDRITQRGWNNVYRLNPPAKEYARGLEELLLKKVKPRSMAIVYENSPYGTGGALRMMWFCREHDIEIRKIIPYHKERDIPSYYEKLLEPLKENPPDAIFMVSYLKDAVLLVNKIREMNITSSLIGGAGGFTSPEFLTMTDSRAENLLTATLWTPQLPYEGTKNYFSQFVNEYKYIPDYHGAEAYSVLLTAADALRRAKSFEPADIRNALDNTNIETPFGPVHFKSYGGFERQNSLPTMVLQIMNNRFECVWPGENASAKFIPDGYRDKQVGRQ